MKLFRKIKNLIKCLLGNHQWIYMWGTYHTGKDVFQCVSCGKTIEE